MAQLPATGEHGKCSVDSRVIDLTGWTYKETGKANDTTNSGTSGVETSKVGTVKYSGTIKGVFDLNDQPAPGLYSGKACALTLYHNTEGGVYFSSAEIQELSVDSEVEGLVTWSATWQGQVAPTWAVEPEYSSSSSSSSSSLSETSRSSTSP